MGELAESLGKSWVECGKGAVLVRNRWVGSEERIAFASYESAGLSEGKVG